MVRRFISDTRLRVAAVLALVWITYLIFNFNPRALILPLFSVFLVSLFDLSITYITKRKLYFPSSSFVTGFLIGLIISPTEMIWVFVLASAMAVFSKHVIRIGENRHIFNPAAFGIFTTSLILGVPIAWWAVSWSPWVIPIITGISYTLYKLKRLWLPISFIIIYLGSVFVVDGSWPLSLFLDGTLFLFAFIMLPEPMTSPSADGWKYLFGPLVAIFVIIIGRIEILPDVFLPALLLGNLTGFFAKRYSRA